ncbi:unannotated protein [freshwater metagenome]|uniref:Unannotated protein n=1 Tax=freshwater metagenome TaxID=449393 RepID=A0A6J6NKL6_9ZZZZ
MPTYPGAVPSLRLRLAATSACLGLLAVAAAGPVSATVSEGSAAARAADPRTTRGLFVDPYMPGSQAAAQDKTFKPIGSRAQPLWITDYYAIDDVRDAVRRYTERANEADKTPLLTIYSIVGRDCGLYSAGGQPDAASYRSWIDQVALGAKDQHAIAILEPDAVPFIGNPACGFDTDERLSLLTYAAKKLSKAGTWVYLDAGHSGWQTPEHMAPLLKRAGIAWARGFSTNVGNFRPTDDERSYAKALVKQLAKVGVSGAKYVIDTGRNGGGKPVDGDVCNPRWARIGKAPKQVLRGSFDGTLWVKNPGESDGESDDGTCHGGPPSGQWWPAGAKRLMGTD